MASPRFLIPPGTNLFPYPLPREIEHLISYQLTEYEDLVSVERVSKAWFMRIQPLWEQIARITFFISEFEMKIQRGSYKNVFITRLEMIRLAIKSRDDSELSVLKGLSEDELKKIESLLGIRFPPDLRFVEKKFQGNTRLRDFLRDREALNATCAENRAYLMDELIDRMLFDVKHNALWLKDWGKKPAVIDLEKVKRNLQTMLPFVIPAGVARYALAEPCVAGNLILSIHQSDTLIVGTDIFDFLCGYFRPVRELTNMTPFHCDLSPLFPRRPNEWWKLIGDGLYEDNANGFEASRDYRYFAPRDLLARARQTSERRARKIESFLSQFDEAQPKLLAAICRHEIKID